MTIETLLLILLILFLAGVFPAWPYSKSWGYKPMGLVSVLLIIFIVWAIIGQRPLFRNSGSVSSTVEEAGRDLKEAGRDVADSIRDTVN